jgi:poly(3-hydroxybutyrate) depolymerase
LYQYFETLHQTWAPWRASALALQKQSPALYANPYLPPAVANTMLAGNRLFERLTRRYEKPAMGLDWTIVDGAETAVTEETVLSKQFCSLVHFRRAVAGADPRVLIVSPMSGHFASLLRGTVEALLPEHDIYVTDWANARDVPLSSGSFDLDDYIDYMLEFLRFLGPNTHVLGVCQGAVPGLAATSLLAAEGSAAQPASVVLMAGPIDGRVNPTAVNDFATSHGIDWFERNMVDLVPQGHAGAGRRVYPGFLQLGSFMSMNIASHVGAHLRYVEDLIEGEAAAVDVHERFYDEYFSVMDLTAEFYVQTVESVFQRFDLARGEMTHRGRPVEPAAVSRTALMTIEGERDDISGIGQTFAAQALCSNLGSGMRTHHLQAHAGHYGVFSGRHWRQEIMPRVRDFIRSHDQG